MHETLVCIAYMYLKRLHFLAPIELVKCYTEKMDILLIKRNIHCQKVSKVTAFKHKIA